MIRFSSIHLLTFSYFVFHGGAALASVTSGVGEPEGGLRTDSYPWAGYGFSVPSTGTKVNQLGYWDHRADGLTHEHTVALFKYSGSGKNYTELASVTVPAGTAAPFEGGYRWVSIPEIQLDDIGQNGNYYVILASHGGDAWTNGLGGGGPMNPSLGTISSGALDRAPSGALYTINSSSTQFGGANFGYGEVSEPGENDEGDFVTPPLKMKTKPLWFWNNATVTSSGVADQMQNARDLDQYGGFGILPFGGGFSPEYLSDSYFEVYGTAVAKAKELGMNLCIYDEFGFPSGSGGASHGDGVPRFANLHPNDTIKRLDKHEADVTGPLRYQRAIPAGKLMACVAMNNATKERIDLTSKSTGSNLTWDVPEGSWKVMLFVMVKDGDPNVDYLDAEASAKFVQMTHQKYFDRFGADFGPDKTIDGVFFDETTLYRAGGRIWTGSFNERFEAKYGFRPEIYYPALWYDIGTDTEAARNYLFGMRSELYATGFPKAVQDWCNDHGGVFATGHQDQEEIVNPCNVSGDLIKCFEHMDVPGIDKIGGGRPTEKFYKVVSSAARNYDKPWVMSETYGAMGNISIDTIYHVAMDQYTKGVNMLIPHAVWYDENQVTFLPELSWRNSLYSNALPAYNRFMGRLNVMLQKEGRNVADIGMLYPMATLQGGNYLDGPLGHYEGGVAIPEADYADVGALLTDVICRDFTFIHPEVLDDKCSVDGNLIHLENQINREQYKVFILPGQRTISWSNLQKIKEFYDNGGKVIGTRMLPSKSAEFGHDADVVRVISEMFGEPELYPITTASSTWASDAYTPLAATDGSMDTRWNAANGTTGNQWLEVDFGSEKTFNRTVVREAFNRISSYRIQYWDGTTWETCATGTTVGTVKTDTFTAVTASKVRFHIDTISGNDSASIYEFEIYEDSGVNLASSGEAVTKENPSGGKTYFLTHANSTNLRAALDDALEVYDVEVEDERRLQYIHKSRDGKSIYYFANLSGAPVDTHVRLCGKLTPQIWNPHTGTVNKEPQFSHVTEGGQTVTRVRLNLANLRSAFIVADTTGAPLPHMSISIQNGKVSLAVSNLEQHQHYVVSKSTDLQEWQFFDGFIAGGPPFTTPSSDGTVSITLLDAVDTRAFYRIKGVD